MPAKTSLYTKLNNSLLFPLLFLTAWYLFAQVGFTFSSRNLAQIFVIGVTKTGGIPSIVLWKLVRFILSELLIHGLLVFFLWSITLLISRQLKLPLQTMIRLGIFLWIITIITITSANQYYFPASKFALLPNTEFWQMVTLVLLIISAFILTASGLIATYSLLHHIKSRVIICLTVLVCIAIYLNSPSHSNTKSLPAQASNEPNIIIIGIDSLRADHTGYFGYTKNLTPHIDKFLANSLLFTNAYTPLARTFSAWASILTGLYPTHNGARENLVDPSSLVLDHTLAKSLHQAGYTTIFSTDDTLFNNITAQFGFDHIILHHDMGASDFIFGLLSDFPLSNLLTNTFAGKILFPASYANRAAAVTYQPKTYNSYINDELQKIQRRPIFLALHLCLVHWPFYFSKQAAIDGLPENVQRRTLEYDFAVKYVDTQFQNIMDLLQKQGLLNNAIVIVLSDHGESFGEDSESIIQKKNYLGTHLPEVTFQPREHGTDVLSFKQYQPLLALQRFGQHPYPRKKIAAPVSLIDIAPTLLDLIHHDSYKMDGISLTKLLYSTKLNPDFTHRQIFLETGLTSEALIQPNQSVLDIVADFIHLYRIDPQTGLLILKKSSNAQLITYKQRALLQGNWVLSSIPYAHGQKLMLVNLKTGQWTDNMDSAFTKHSPEKQMLAQMRSFYGNELR